MILQIRSEDRTQSPRRSRVAHPPIHEIRTIRRLSSRLLFRWRIHCHSPISTQSQTGIHERRAARRSRSPRSLLRFALCALHNAHRDTPILTPAFGASQHRYLLSRLEGTPTLVWKNTEYGTYNGLVGTTHARERGQRAESHWIAGDLFTSEWA